LDRYFFHSIFYLSVVSYPITVSYIIVMLMTLSSILLSLKTQSGLDRLTNCSVNQKHWFLAHDLLLNPTKSESSYLGTRQRLDIFNLPTDIDIADSHIPVHDLLKILGVTIDKHFTFAPRAQFVVKSCNYHIQALLKLNS